MRLPCEKYAENFVSLKNCYILHFVNEYALHHDNETQNTKRIYFDEKNFLTTLNFV